MSWFDYFSRTSVVQIVRDCREYRGLRGQLRQVRSDMAYSLRLLTKEYDIEDDVRVGNSCLKHKMILEPDVFNGGVGQFVLSRCKFFAPIDDEQLCPNYKCACWARNNRYYQDLSLVKELKHKIDNFWANKYAKVK